MVLIIGGAYQGKTDFAKERFAVRDEEIFTCTRETEPDWNARCLRRMEEYVWRCVREGKAPELRFRPDAVVIADDIFCGVVPLDPAERAWREECGRYLGRIARESEKVYRIFCGLEKCLK